MSFFGWQDGNQGNVGEPNIPNTLYSPASEDTTKVEWECAPQYPPDDCNKNIAFVPKQIQSLFSNLYSAIAALAKRKNAITGAKQVIPSCDGDANALTVFGDLLTDVLDGVLTKDQLPAAISELGCSVANAPSTAITPQNDDVILIIRKGATASAPCQLLSTNLNNIAFAQYKIMPLVDVSSMGGIHQFNIWSQSNQNATEQLLNINGDVLGYVSLSANIFATVAVTDSNMTPTQFYAAP